jgi:EAL domain-containing protein (putative c-di-GMP-specific phosphodiesterase class I)
MGVRLSLDDFGTGYSSLLYLQQYPFDEIKVDKGFVQHMLADPYSHEIVATVVGVAGALGADVVAEGVETPRERDALIAMGCRIAQGFHYSMPLAEEDFRWLLETHSTLPLMPKG